MPFIFLGNYFLEKFFDLLYWMLHLDKIVCYNCSHTCNLNGARANLRSHNDFFKNVFDELNFVHLFPPIFYFLHPVPDAYFADKLKPGAENNSHASSFYRSRKCFS